MLVAAGWRRAVVPAGLALHGRGLVVSTALMIVVVVPALRWIRAPWILEPVLVIGPRRLVVTLVVTLVVALIIALVVTLSALF